MDWPLLKHLWGRGRRAEHPQAGRQLDGRAVGGAVLSTLKPIARRHWSGCNAWLSVLWISTCEIAAISAHQRPSKAIRGHQRSSAAIRYHEWPSKVISGHQWPSVAISGHQWPSVAISGHQWQSVAIRGHQWQSVAIRGHQWPSVAIRGNQSLHLLEYERIPRLQRHLWGSDREARAPW